jgi:hypothetical protein
MLSRCASVACRTLAENCCECWGSAGVSVKCGVVCSNSIEGPGVCMQQLHSRCCVEAVPAST